MILVYINLTNREVAKNLAKQILESKIAGWVDILESESLYIDHQKINEGKNVVLLVQTNELRLQPLEELVEKAEEKIIPPATISFSVYRLNRSYKDWLVSKIV